MRVIGIDWSGDQRHASRRIWLAEVVDGELQAPVSGRSPAEVVDYLIAVASEGPIVAGFDFGFSFPEWFVAREGCRTVFELWRRVEQSGENWLARCEPPFWGRPGKPRPEPDESEPYFRQTEKDAPISPKSVFQIGGRGAVGTGSIRGMPLLLRLHNDRDFRIWPFEDAGLRLVVEIYPRLLTGPVNKSEEASRRAHLRRDGRVPAQHVDLVAGAEDPFDAVISALVMHDYVEELLKLPALAQPYASEGAIWWPGATASSED